MRKAIEEKNKSLFKVINILTLNKIEKRIKNKESSRAQKIGEEAEKKERS